MGTPNQLLGITAMRSAPSPRASPSHGEQLQFLATDCPGSPSYERVQKQKTKLDPV